MLKDRTGILVEKEAHEEFNKNSVVVSVSQAFINDSREALNRAWFCCKNKVEHVALLTV